VSVRTKSLVTRLCLVSNQVCYFFLRSALQILVGSEAARNWVEKNQEYHWLRFPFNLRGSVFWSPSLSIWYELLDYECIGLMTQVPEFLGQQPRPGDVFIDVGAHIGSYTCFAARNVGTRGIVVAIEPHYENFRDLLHNLQLNGINNVIPVCVAAWDQETALNLVVDNRYSSMHRVSTRSDQPHDIYVGALTLDHLIQKLSLPSVDWIKIDVEGAECDVLEGARETLRRFSPRLFVELHGTMTQVEKIFDSIRYWIEKLKWDGPESSRGWVLARPVSKP